MAKIDEKCRGEMAKGLRYINNDIFNLIVKSKAGLTAVEETEFTTIMRWIQTLETKMYVTPLPGSGVRSFPSLRDALFSLQLASI